MGGLLLLLVQLLVSALPAHAQDARSAEAFVRSLYSDDAPQRGRAFWDADATRAVATPSLAALRQRDLDAEQAAEDPSDLNFSPLCDCQDDDGLHVVRVAVRPLRAGRATAAVTLGFRGASQVILELDLAAMGRDWRIDDIRSRSNPYGWSLRTLLARSIAGHVGAAR